VARRTFLANINHPHENGKAVLCAESRRNRADPHAGIAPSAMTPTPSASESAVENETRDVRCRFKPRGAGCAMKPQGTTSVIQPWQRSGVAASKICYAGSMGF